MLVRLDFLGNPYLGVYGRVTESWAFLPPGIPDGIRRKVAEATGAEPVTALLGGASILGSLVVANSSGILVADFAGDDDLALLGRTGLRVSRLTGKLNAAGNNVLANDSGAVVHPDLRDKDVRRISEALGVPVERGTVAGLKTVGSAASATKKGVLCHPKATEEELELIERILQVAPDIGTVNHGSPYIGAGLLANSKGAAIGQATTGPELNRIEDALGYF